MIMKNLLLKSKTLLNVLFILMVTLTGSVNLLFKDAVAEKLEYYMEKGRTKRKQAVVKYSVAIT